MSTDPVAQLALFARARGPARKGAALWIAAIAVVSFLVSFVLVDRMAVSRNAFVLGHGIASGVVLAAYAAWSRVSLRELVGNPPARRAGLAGGVVAGALMIGFVLAGPRSPAPGAWELAGAIVWVGIVYATIDALLLSVFPVVAAAQLLGTDPPALGARRLSVQLAALAICALLTVTYHLGFPEFRGAALASALIGNTIMTLSYLATRSAVAPVLAHICLHITAVSFGYLNAIPTPPHY